MQKPRRALKIQFQLTELLQFSTVSVCKNPAFGPRPLGFDPLCSGRGYGVEPVCCGEGFGKKRKTWTLFTEPELGAPLPWRDSLVEELSMRATATTGKREGEEGETEQWLTVEVPVESGRSGTKGGGRNCQRRAAAGERFGEDDGEQEGSGIDCFGQEEEGYAAELPVPLAGLGVAGVDAAMEG